LPAQKEQFFFVLNLNALKVYQWPVIIFKYLKYNEQKTKRKNKEGLIITSTTSKASPSTSSVDWNTLKKLLAFREKRASN
jgi:hypothetical protein